MFAAISDYLLSLQIYKTSYVKKWHRVYFLYTILIFNVFVHYNNFFYHIFRKKHLAIHHQIDLQQH